MKKLLFAILLFAGFGSMAQHTVPRFGTTAGKDNTFRLLTNGYTTITDAAGTLDTVIINPHYYNNTYRIVLVDSVTLGNPVVTNSWAGDNLTFIVSTAAGSHVLYFLGSNWITAGTATMTTRLRSVIRFIFDGAKWVETGRYTQ
jgi:hypothetical protein